MLPSSVHPSESLKQKITASIPFLIIGFGIAVRLTQYFSNRSLWADEAALALNIVNRSWAEMFQPLDYEQVAPIGFLLIEKLAVQLFGDSELVLRLFPLICGILSLFLFYRLAKSLFPTLTVTIALLLFAATKSLIYYASEVKQYSSDVAIALLCFLIAQKLSQPSLSRQETIAISLIGASLIWFSHPAIFVLMSAGIGFTCICYFSGKIFPFKQIAIVISSWLLSFLLFYYAYLKQVSEQSNLVRSWQVKEGFPGSIWDIQWLAQDALLGFLDEVMSLSESGIWLSSFFLTVGILLALYQKQQAKIVLILPTLITLLAAYLHKYPFQGRVILFLVPFWLLLVAEGITGCVQVIQAIVQKTAFRLNLNSHIRQVLKVLLPTVLVAPFIIPILDTASTFLIKPQHKSDIKAALGYIKTRQEPGDQIYVFQRGALQFQYYAAKFGFQAKDYRIGVDDLDSQDGYDFSLAEQQRYQADLDRLQGQQRVWVLFSHAHLRAEFDWIRNYLDKIGRRQDKYKKRGVSIYLYDLSRKKR